MADFNRAMSQMLSVFSGELGGKVSVREIEGMPRLGFLAIPGTEYSDRIYAEYYPRKETTEVIKATNHLRKIAANRRNPPKRSAAFSLSEFTQTMSEALRVFAEELGGRITMQELGTNVRLAMFTKTGVEQSDMLYKEFYPARETGELRKAVAVLKGIAAKRRSGGYSGNVRPPVRREPHTYTNNAQNFYSPAKPLVKKAITPRQTTGFMVFDYTSFTMKPISAYI